MLDIKNLFQQSSYAMKKSREDVQSSPLEVCFGCFFNANKINLSGMA